MSWQTEYLARFYSRERGWVDGTTLFHRLCRQFISPDDRVLEVGAGPSNPTSKFLSSTARQVVGVDIDDAIIGNCFLSEAHVYDGVRFPFDDGSFDAAVCNYVMEHVENPMRLCREIRRVLVPGGVFLFRTPNAFHYVSLLSRVLPRGLSKWARNTRPNTSGMHPMFCRCNSTLRCRRILDRAGLRIAELRLIEPNPSYGMRSRLLFFPMLLYERLVNATEMLRHFRANILCAARSV